MLVEPATPDDIPALCELLSVLFSQEAEFAPDAPAQKRGLTRILENPEAGVVLVARQEGEVVGMVCLLYTISTALGDKVALLEDMVVSPGQRASGVGGDLLASAISFARAQGCRRITLLTDRDNHSAQRFYARQGFLMSNMLPMRLALT